VIDSAAPLLDRMA